MERADIAISACSIEKHIHIEAAASIQFYRHIFVHGNGFDRGIEENFDATRLHLSDELVADLLIHVRQDSVFIVYEVDLRSHGGEDGGIFASDDSCSDDAERGGESFDLQNRI